MHISADPTQRVRPVVIIAILAGCSIVFIFFRFFVLGLLLAIPGPWYSYHAPLPDGGNITYKFRTVTPGDYQTCLIWTTPAGKRRSFMAYSYYAFQHDVEFRLDEERQGLWLIGYSPEGKSHVQGVLEFRPAKFWDAEATSFPDWVDPNGGKLLSRWLQVPAMCKPRLYIHWSPKLGSTVLRSKQRVGGEEHGVVIESGRPVYRDGELRGVVTRRISVLFVECSSSAEPQVRAAFDCSQREFIDEHRFVWRYGEKAEQPITKSSKPVASYPDWATPAAGEVIARPHKPAASLPETGDSE